MCTLRVAPLYVLAVTAISVVLNQALTPAQRDSVVVSQSTNVENLRAGHWWVLVTSAFIIDGRVKVTKIVGLLVVLGAGELLWGWKRLVGVFFFAHVVATLLVFFALEAGLRGGFVPSSVTTAHDVGTSYGAHGVAGALLWSLPRRLGRLLGGALVLLLLGALFVDHTFTDLGHLTATTIGIGLGWVMHRHPVRRRLPPCSLRGSRRQAVSPGTGEVVKGSESGPGR